MAQLPYGPRAIRKDESSRKMQSCCPISCSSDLFELVLIDLMWSTTLTNAWTVDPWVVQVTFAAFDQQNLKIMVQIRQSKTLLGTTTDLKG
jgi:hypothetical protein